MRQLSWLVLMTFWLAACAAPTATPRPAAPTSTVKPFPPFGPTRTVTPTRTPRPTATDLFVATIGLPAATREPTATPTTTPRAANPQPIGSAATRRPGGPAGQLARSAAPAALKQALIAAGVRNPQVTWFTFDEGDREEALLIQYDSALPWQPGYLEMLRATQRVLGRYYLAIQPPLYSAFIAAKDITGDSRITARVRRTAAEQLASGDISEEDFINNYLEYVNLVLTCDGTPGTPCLAKMATPFPTFDFPFPFPTPSVAAP